MDEPSINLAASLLEIKSPSSFLAVIRALSPESRQTLFFSREPNQMRFLFDFAATYERFESSKLSTLEPNDSFIRTLSSLLPHDTHLFSPDDCLREVSCRAHSYCPLLATELFDRALPSLNQVNGMGVLYELLSLSRRAQDKSAYIPVIERLLNTVSLDLNQPIQHIHLHGVSHPDSIADAPVDKSTPDRMSTLLSTYYLEVKDGEHNELPQEPPLYPLLMSSSKAMLKLLLAHGADLTVRPNPDHPATILSYLPFRQLAHFVSSNARADMIKEANEHVGHVSTFDEFLQIFTAPKHTTDLEQVILASNNEWLKWRTPTGASVSHLLALAHPYTLSRLLRDKRLNLSSKEVLALRDDEGYTVQDYLHVARPAVHYGVKAQETLIPGFVKNDAAPPAEYFRRLFLHTHLLLRHNLMDTAITSEKKSQYTVFQSFYRGQSREHPFGRLFEGLTNNPAPLRSTQDMLRVFAHLFYEQPNSYHFDMDKQLLELIDRTTSYLHTYRNQFDFSDSPTLLFDLSIWLHFHDKPHSELILEGLREHNVLSLEHLTAHIKKQLSYNRIHDNNLPEMTSLIERHLLHKSASNAADTNFQLKRKIL
jgi:hypothetical protein